jgi:single-strand DNA-binding protein
MAKSVNKVILVGSLGKDPEVKTTAGGTSVAKFSLATNDRQKDKSGEWQDVTEWHNLVAFGKTAEISGEYLKKGSKAYVEGKLKTSSWEDKQSGEKKYRTEIVVDDLVLLGGSGNGQSTSNGNGNASAARPQSQAPGRAAQGRQSQPVPAGNFDDEDIPF